MKKALYFIILILLIILLFSLSRRLLTTQDGWLCQNGHWVRQGDPSQPMPAVPCATTTPVMTPTGQKNNEKIVVITPPPNSEVISPLEVTGNARGSWYFEASFPIKLLDASGKVIASAVAQAQGDWMTENFVPFRAELTFKTPAAKTGALILERDNPSGLPQNDESISIPVTFAVSKPAAVKIYFSNSKIDPGAMDCSKNYAVTRSIPPTDAVGRAALEQLLLGPAAAEKAQGFFTSINEGVAINTLIISNGIATVDLSPKLEEAVGGSCRVTAIRAQIVNTLKQFATIKEVIISINGRTDDILQP